MTSLDELRCEIDALDEQMVRLLDKRAAAVVEVGRLKTESGSGVFAPDREREILDRITRLSDGPIPKRSLLAIYRELMSASFALERPPRVGFLGPQGSFSHEAAVGKFGASVEYESLLDIRGVFDELARGHVDYGVVPVENTTGGAVMDALDAFVEHDVKICCEIHRAIHHNLMAQCSLDEVETVYSKPEVFTQCQRWLAETGLAQKVFPAPSTSKAAELARAQAKSAAIGGALASRIYDLPIQAGNIEDSPNNATRFFVLAHSAAKPTGSDKTSLMFITAHRAGALVEVLLVFQKAKINMTMITSRPSARADLEYNFFVDIEGHAEDAPVRSAVEEARHHCQTFRVLGSYPMTREVVAG